jgi:predicted RNA binding protein YcfA (HicA-like mRNA interferase family)
MVNGVRRIVTISGKDGEDVSRKLLASIRRQSALPRKLFRK